MKTIQKKGNYSSVPFMKMDVKIHDEMLANRIQWYVKIIIYYSQRVFICKCKAGATLTTIKQCNLLYQQAKEEKLYEPINWYRKRTF